MVKKMNVKKKMGIVKTMKLRKKVGMVKRLRKICETG
jgi:hypothetical protein